MAEEACPVDLPEQGVEPTVMVSVDTQDPNITIVHEVPPGGPAQ